MKQILQNRRTGLVEVAEVPAPSARRGRLLVRTGASLISAGTERAAVGQNKKGLIGRALEQPELVGKVVRRAREEGLASAVGAVRAKLEESVALGYSAAGVVEEVGEEVEGFRRGDRVACAGVGYASHAELLSVPRNLCVRVPDRVGFDEAAYSTLGAIALQGVRLAAPTLGESIVVIGLGLLGQLASQLLRANGCRVYGVDLDASKVELAGRLGAEGGCAPDAEAARKISEWTKGRGADAVLITAATESSQPVELAGEVSRLRGRVVVVGQVGMDVPRDVYFRRELSLQVSMSYGPGRYDPEYEERGRDYPLPYVRWTEGRNLEAFLDLVAAGAVDVKSLTTHRFPVDEGARAYGLITGEAGEPYLGVLLEYDTAREVRRGAGAVDERRAVETASTARVGLIGAGGYATGVLVPHFKAAGAELRAVASASGVSALNAGRRFGFERVAEGAEEIFNDAKVNLVVVATRHDTHAELARRALETGRHVFVEKPLALTEEELEGVLEAAGRGRGLLMVGFNRRFSPLARKAKEFFSERRGPLSFVYRVNAGRVPREHWTQDPREGGGRLIGEVCHFVDLMQFWAGSAPARVYAESVRGGGAQAVDEDSLMLTLGFADGSNGVVAYVAEGDKSLPKERVEIFGGGRAFVLEDFRSATMHVGGREEKTRPRAQDKGQAEQARAVCAAVTGRGPAPIPLEELAATTRATFRALESLRAGRALDV
ncbi:MAG TPA: bi-domain-containing oxidoreductase [Pyrinomonadaceae bacterium]|jgi:predicted dehydrogenase/threonine dehydrogenase-like Zn-dependent dehydrogenase|nr:bi-domain-containing oxidoreductase [Pyrinomonadaceae bacterium]